MLFTIMDDDASLRVGILLLGHQYPSLLRFYPWSDSAAAGFPKYIFSYRSVSFEYSRQPKQHINQSESYFSVLSISIAAPWGSGLEEYWKSCWATRPTIIVLPASYPRFTFTYFTSSTVMRCTFVSSAIICLRLVDLQEADRVIAQISCPSHSICDSIKVSRRTRLVR